MYTIKELKELPDGTIIYDCWGAEFIKEGSGLRNTITRELIDWSIVYDLYYDTSYLEETDYEI